ncbi:dual specificity protein kinase splB-like [Argonauta hians]
MSEINNNITQAPLSLIDDNKNDNGSLNGVTATNSSIISNSTTTTANTTVASETNTIEASSSSSTTNTTTIASTTTNNNIASSNTTTITNNNSSNNTHNDDFSSNPDLGLHNAFELLELDSKTWKLSEEKTCDRLQPPVQCQQEGNQLSSNTLTGDSAAPRPNVSSAELMTGCISSLQKLKLICPECQKAKCCKVYLKKRLSSSMLDKFNLARSLSSCRGVIKEARFRPHPSDCSERSVLRASRLKFLSQFNANKRAKHGICKNKSSKLEVGAIFGHCSERSFANFASLAQNTSATYKIPVLANDMTAPQFLAYQHNLSSERLSYPSMINQSPLDMRLSSLAVNSPLSIEKTCSLQARLDDMSVNELACYFEEFVHIPKKMSEMAEMMYR